MNKTVSIIIILVVIVVAGVLLLNKGDSALITNSSEPVALHTLLGVEQGASSLTDGNFALTPGSGILWASNKTLIPTWVDKGTVQATSGSLTISAGVPVAGAFEFDMNSIASTMVGGELRDNDDDKLAGHLKSADWFNTEVYPTATFVLTRAVPVGEAHKFEITGRLTFKDIQQEISFDAYVYALNGQLKLRGAADIDRTKWDIRFGSQQYFKDLGDKVINDMIAIDFDISAQQVQ
jgi:polyisoprenoid-binding protein YceI